MIKLFLNISKVTFCDIKLIPIKRKRRFIALSFLVCFLWFTPLTLLSQNTKIDSLNILITQSESDTTKVQLMLDLSKEFFGSDSKRAISISEEAKALSESIDFKSGIAYSLKNIGLGHYYLSDYVQAREYFERSMAICEEIQYKHEMAIINDRIGLTYNKQHNYKKAHEYYIKGLTISKQIDNKRIMALLYTHIGVNYFSRGDFSQNALSNFKKASKIYEEIGNKQQLAAMNGRTGAIYFYQGNYPKALHDFKEYLEYSLESGDSLSLSIAYENIGAIYYIQKNYDKAIYHYERSLAINKNVGDQSDVAGTYFNIAESYQGQGKFSRSLEYFHKSLIISKENDDKDLIAYCYRGIGLIYFDQKEYTEARNYFQQSLEAAQDIGYESIIGANYTSLGIISSYFLDHQKAINQCSKGLDLSQKIGALNQQKIACDCLYKSYKALGNTPKALEYHEKYLSLSDSIQNDETAKQLQQMEFDRQILEDSIKQEEEKLLAKLESQEQISKEKTRKNLFMYGGIIMVILAISIYRRMSHIRKSRILIQAEKDKSDNLLLNILPSAVADELKEKGESSAKDFEDVSVLFTDFIGFTNISEKLSPQELVAEINTSFKAFDRIITSYGIEKIKTIGDSYMAAGGLPVPSEDSVKNTVLAALDMQAFIADRITVKRANNEIPFEMRLGIHTGPVVAGIVGVKKFQYDIWGDTVNTASRMESSGKIGKVNISQHTYELIKNDPQFTFETRGKIQAKGKGELEMYFVKLNVAA